MSRCPAATHPPPVSLLGWALSSSTFRSPSCCCMGVRGGALECTCVCARGDVCMRACMRVRLLCMLCVTACACVWLCGYARVMSLCVSVGLGGGGWVGAAGDGEQPLGGKDAAGLDLKWHLLQVSARARGAVWLRVGGCCSRVVCEEGRKAGSVIRCGSVGVSRCGSVGARGCVTEAAGVCE